MKTSSNTDNDHKKVLALLRRGDPFALELMYDLFAPMLYGAAIKIANSEKRAEELIQKVLLYFYNNYSSFDETKQNIHLWLISILRMYAGKKMKIVSHISNQQRLFYVNSGNAESKSEPAPLFKHTVDESETKTNPKNILDLVFFGGKEISAVAKSLNMDENKIKKMIREAVNTHRKEKGTWK